MGSVSYDQFLIQKFRVQPVMLGPGGNIQIFVLGSKGLDLANITAMNTVPLLLLLSS